MATVNNTATTFADRTALSLPDLKKDLLTAFHASHQFAPRALSKTINSYSGRFPASGKLAAPSYHTPGTRLLGGTPPKRAYKDIVLDDRIVLHLFIDELDNNARAIIPFQSMYAMEMGMSIANFDDQNTAIVAVNNARASATVNGEDGGNVVSKAGCDTNIGSLNACLWDGKNSFDLKNIPAPGRSLGLRPTQFNLIAASLDRMFYRQLGQGGSIGAPVSLPEYAGWSEIFMSNNIPSTNISSNPSGAQNTYSGDFTKTVGVGFAPGAFGTVNTSASLPQGGGSQPQPVGADTGAQFQPIDVREVEIREAYGTLVLASLVTGHGGLRPECGLEIKTP